MKFDDLNLKDRVFIDANIFIHSSGGHSLAKETVTRLNWEQYYLFINIIETDVKV